MRSLLVFFLVLAVSTTARPSLQGATPTHEIAVSPAIETADRAGVIAQERRWVTAIADRDSTALDSILADDFIDTSWRGVLRSKSDMLAALRLGRTHANRISDVHASVYGRTAIVRGINTATGAKGETARLRFTDVFVYRHGQWIAESAQETLVASPR